MNKGIDITTIKSRKYTIQIKHKSNYYKICKLIFNKKEGSIYLALPYFKKTEGIVGHYTEPKGRGPGKMQQNLEDGGKVTSQKIKFSHHPSGRVHFSQDGKVKTEIKRQSQEFGCRYIHFGTIYIQGLDGFNYKANHEDKISKRDQTLTFSFENPETESYKIILRLFNFKGLIDFIGSKREKVGPNFIGKGNDGEILPTFLVSPLDDTPYNQQIMVISIQNIPDISTDRDTYLLFIGGFDTLEHATNSNHETGYLIFSCPAQNYGEIEKRMGSIDFTDIDETK